MCTETMSFLMGVSGILLGGLPLTAVIIFLVKKTTENAIKHTFDQHIEKLKSSLKKSETFFSLQLEALTKLRRIFRHLLPKQSHPDEDIGDAYEYMSSFFSSHLDDLDEFLCKYQDILPNRVVVKLEEAISLATEGSFQADEHFSGGFTLEEKRKFLAKRWETQKTFYQAIKTAVSTLQSEVKSQIGSRDKATGV